MRRRASIKPDLALAAAAALLGGCGHKPTYAEGCGPLPDGWITPRQGRGELSVLSLVSVAADGTILFNGTRVSRPTFAAYLERTAKMNPVPVTQVRFAPALDCDTVQSIRRIMVESLDCRFGRCAEGRGKWWMIGDVVFDGAAPEPYDPDPSRPQANDE